MIVWTGILIVLIIIFTVVLVKIENDVTWVISIFGITASASALVMIFIIGFGYLSLSTEYSKTNLTPFVCIQKCSYEDAQKIIDQQKRNEWIIDAQLAKETWGMFSLYPQSVMDLKLIK